MRRRRAQVYLVLSSSLMWNGCTARRSTEALTSAEILGHRTLVETGGGLVREFDAESPPYFRLRAPGPDRIEPTFTADGRTFALPVAKTERRGPWLIVRTAAPESIPASRGEVRLADRAWPAAWTVAGEDPPSELRARYRRSAELATEVRKGGDSAAYARALLTAAEAAKEAGLVSEVSRMWRAAAYAHLYGRRFREVGPLLEQAEALDDRLGNISGRVRAAHYRGYLLTQQGRLREARDVLTEGLAQAELYGLDRDRGDLKLSLAALLQDLGRHAEALQLHREVAERFADGSTIERISYSINLGWAELRAIEAGATSVPFDRPRRHLLDALELSRATGDRHEEANALANLLWLAHLEGDATASEKWLGALSDGPQVDASYARLFIPFARAHVRLRQGRLDEAERAFDALRESARLEAAGASSDYQWRAWYGLGQVRLLRGDDAGAAVRFRRAIDELDRLARETDLSTSRALFFQDRMALFEDAAALALRTKRPFEALTFADRAKIHVLQALQANVRIERLDPDARQIWQDRASEYLRLRDVFEQRGRETELVEGSRIAEFEAETLRMRSRLKEQFDDLYAYLDRVSPAGAAVEITEARITAALGPDAALILFAGLGDRTVSYVVTATSIEHRQGSSLLEALPRKSSDELEHLYVVAGGAASVRSVLAELARRPQFLERATISFLTHVGALFESSAAASGPAVVVADPDGTLPHAAEEGAWVAKQLEAEPPLMGPGVTRADFIGRLAGASVFHFSGHGVLTAAQPWDAHLVLGRGETLSLEDLLVAQPRIGLVVLSGCETGSVSPLSATEGIGLPHAFALAGARAVLATTSAISDAAALRFVRRFYEAGGAARPIEAYRRAALEAIASNDETWRAFYVVGRRE